MTLMIFPERKNRERRKGGKEERRKGGKKVLC
jgi:hypothetical protein